jgi:LDH2 family malate/lactate/ureidoglycolate dehydrogenase
MLHTPDVPSDSGQEIIVSADALKQLMIDILVKKGMFAVEAKISASRMIESDLRGIHSHGSRAIKRYVEWMDDGDIDPRAQTLTIRETAAMAVLDGGSGLGHVAATKAMQMAIQKAKEVGTGTVAIKNGQHYGASSAYALMAVEAGMIGYTTTNTGPATVAAYGSRQGAVANNAFAWGVPTPSGPPFVLDMACAVSSWGKVESLGLYGGSLPEGWALDVDGNPTSDPKTAKTLLPAAGARGYGLAFVSSVLAGTLVGGRMPFHKNRSPAADGSEHFFYAIDLSQFVDPDKYDAEIEATIADIRGLAPIEGFDKVRLPGELEWERAERWKVEGIPIHRDHANRLEETAKALKIELPW